jgi:glycosyltransferase involved in cell wall biosynthesis
MTGSLELSKDHPTLLRAVALLKQRGHNIRLRLVGGGSQTEALKQLASELQIADNTDWTGSVRDVPAELARFDVYAFSAKPEEGLGIALIEAMASGLPVLATDIPAVREIFKFHPQGIKVPFGDAEKMAEGILRTAQQPAAPREALSRFDVAQTFREYDGILASQRMSSMRKLMQK